MLLFQFFLRWLRQSRRAGWCGRRRPLLAVLLILNLPLAVAAGDPEDPVTGLDWRPEGSGRGAAWGWSNSWGNWGSGAPSPPYFNCNRPGENAANCGLRSGEDPDKTPFLQEVVSFNGRSYYHVIVGLPGQDFAQEAFIGTGGGSFLWGDSGSGGQGSCMCSWSNTRGMSGNGWDPLNSNSSFSGNGTGNPTQVVMRQIVRSAEMQQEFLKDRLAYKPQISQSVTTPDVRTNFVVDMRSIDYASSSTPVDMINTVIFSDPSLPEFDIKATASTADVEVAAGRYTYRGNVGGGWGGWGGWPGWSGGGGSVSSAYLYEDGAPAPLAADWSQFYDPLQNGGRPAAGNVGKDIPSGGGFPFF